MKYLTKILVVCAGLIVIYLLVGTTVRKQQFRYTATVEQTVDNAFKTLVNPFQFHKWIPGFKSIKPMDGEPASFTANNIIVIEYRGKEANIFQTITGFSKNRYFACVCTFRSFEIRAGFRFDRLDDKSGMDLHLIISTNSLFRRPLLVILKPRLKREVREIMDRLVEVMESGNNTILFY